MLRTILTRVMWLGRATVFAVGLAVTLALMLGVVTAALAAVPGDPFKLGEVNEINDVTALVGNVDGAMLEIINKSSGLNATALDLKVEPKKPPMKVNSSERVSNLNADRLDNRSAADFYLRDERVADSERLDGMGPAGVFTQRSTTYRVQATVSGAGSGGTRTLSASCDPGDKVLSGGGSVHNQNDNLLATYPSAPPSQGWKVWVEDNGASSVFYAWTLCTDFPPLRP